MEFVWILIRGNDDKYESEEGFIDAYSSKVRAKKGAQEFMNGYSSIDNNWWEMTKNKDEITWHWFYDIKGKRDSGRYVQIRKCKVK